MIKKMTSGGVACLISLPSLLLVGCSTSSLSVRDPQTFAVGATSAGEPCVANRTFADQTVSGESAVSGRAYTITCRTVTANRAVGMVRSVAEASAVDAIEATLACGEARPVDVEGVGNVQARRCFDRTIGEPTVSLSLRRGGRHIVASAIPGTLGQAEQAIRYLLSRDEVTSSNDLVRSSIELGSLAAAPDLGGIATRAAFDPEIALQQGISLNLKGRHVEASRALNDALSRLAPDASPQVRAELLLEAALADSNINFTEAAQDHFQRANAILDAEPGNAEGFLLRKRDIYTALSLMNRRQFRSAMAILDRLAGPGPQAGDPLRDPAILQALNQPRAGGGDLSRAVGVFDTQIFRQLLLQTQANWARSISMLALNDVSGAETALAAADHSFAPLQSGQIDPVSVLWLQARLDRQRARISVRKRDWAAAQSHYDRALDVLTRSSVGTLGSESDPAISELRLERASLWLDRGAPREEVVREYDEAIGALIASGASSASVSVGLSRYLRYLASEAERPVAEADQERFFRAIQASGEPAIARQLNQIEEDLSADPVRGRRLRERRDLENELTQLRYGLQNAQAGGDAAQVGALEARRQAAQRRLSELEVELAGDARLGQVEERPATLAEVRQALRPGEVYFKLVEMAGLNYGIIVGEDGTSIYRILATGTQLRDLVHHIRDSIDGGPKSGRGILAYDVPRAFTLFRLLGGTFTERLIRATAIVVDPAGPLQSLPLGVLVTDQASVTAYRSPRRARTDFSGINFLAGRAAIATAVSPRSFINTRGRSASQASQPFIAFAQPAAPAAASRREEVNFGACSIPYQQFVALHQRLAPLDLREAQISARAAGVPGAPVISGSQFTDSAVVSRDDLNQFQVLHFATHGFTEGAFGCANSPPALLTTLADEDSNGLLTFVEVARLNLDANLVVLAACDTGAGIRSQRLARLSGQEEAGASLEGLVRAFLTANSRAVMATHWPVSAAEESNEFMRVFYTSARTQPIGNSLQAAQQVLMRNPAYSHPYFWGAYFVVGDASKMALNRGSVANAGSGAVATGR